MSGPSQLCIDVPLLILFCSSLWLPGRPKLDKTFWPCCIKRQKTEICAKKHKYHWCAEFPGKSHQSNPRTKHYRMGTISWGPFWSTEHMESWVCGAFAVSDDVDWLLLHVFVDGEAPRVKSGRPEWVTSGFQLRVCFLMGIAGTVCDHQKLPLLQCFFHGNQVLILEKE